MTAASASSMDGVPGSHYPTIRRPAGRYSGPPPHRSPID
jgi:hypothetical protein